MFYIYIHRNLPKTEGEDFYVQTSHPSFKIWRLYQEANNCP